MKPTLTASSLQILAPGATPRPGTCLLRRLHDSVLLHLLATLAKSTSSATPALSMFIAGCKLRRMRGRPTLPVVCDALCVPLQVIRVQVQQVQKPGARGP